MSAKVEFDKDLVDLWLSKPSLDIIVKYESRNWRYIRRHPIYQYLSESVITRLQRSYNNNLKIALNNELTSLEIEITAKVYQSPMYIRYIETCAEYMFKFLGDSQICNFYKLECSSVFNPRNIEPSQIKKHDSRTNDEIIKKLRYWTRSRHPITIKKIQEIAKANTNKIQNINRRFKQFHFLGLAMAERFTDKQIFLLHTYLFSPLGLKRQKIFEKVCEQTFEDLEDETLTLVGRVAIAYDKFNIYFSISHEESSQKAEKIKALFQIAASLTRPTSEEVKKIIHENPELLTNLI